MRARVPFFHSWGIELLVTQVRGLDITRTDGAVFIARAFIIVAWVRFDIRCPVEAPAPSRRKSPGNKATRSLFLLCFNLK